MSWVRVDYNLTRHPKVAAAAATLGGTAARARVVATWLEVLCYAAEFETDGFISDMAIESLANDRRPHDVCAALCTVPPGYEHGLLVRDADGYRLHGFDERQPTREQREQKRSAAKARMTALRERRKDAVRANNSERSQSVREKFVLHGTERNGTEQEQVPRAKPAALRSVERSRGDVRGHLRAIAHRMLDENPAELDAELKAELKLAAVRLGHPCDGDSIGAVIDAVRSMRQRREAG